MLMDKRDEIFIRLIEYDMSGKNPKRKALEQEVIIKEMAESVMLLKENVSLVQDEINLLQRTNDNLWSNMLKTRP